MALNWSSVCGVLSFKRERERERESGINISSMKTTPVFKCACILKLLEFVIVKTIFMSVYIFVQYK